MRDQVADLAAGMPLLFATDFSLNGNSSPRIARELYATGTLGRLVLATASGDLTEAANPHWPDEIASGSIIYPIRFPLLPLAVAEDVELSEYPPALGYALHWSINQQSSGNIIELDWSTLDQLAEQAGLNEWPREKTSAADTPGIEVAQFIPPKGTAASGGGAGYIQNAAARKAVEQHAVAIARSYYETLGYTVTEFGKPFDLECVRSDGTLHVEVKGTTSQAATVELTSGEVLHAQQYPTELAVVSGITLDSLNDDPTATGGDLTVFAEWVPAAEALRPIRFQYQVPWPSTG